MGSVTQPSQMNIRVRSQRSTSKSKHAAVHLYFHPFFVTAVIFLVAAAILYIAFTQMMAEL